MRRILLAVCFIYITIGVSLSQTSLEGKLTDAETSEAILFGTVAIYKNGVLITGTDSDFDGNYFFSNLEPGTYDIEASYIGYSSQRQTGVVVKAGRTNKLDFAMNVEGILMDAVEIVEYREPLIEIDNTTSGGTVTAEEIRALPQKNVNALAATTAGLSSIDGGAINIRGSRTNATAYYIDGIRVTGLIPESEIEQMQVLTGGLGAEFGDVIGGAISITSKGPSSEFSGGVDLETSEFLDAYGYNQLRANLSGPLLKNSDGNSILGFRFSGQYLYQPDRSPSAVGSYRASEELIDQLEANPTFQVGQSEFATAVNLTNDDIGGPWDRRPNDERTDIDITGKLDARITKNIDVSLSGSWDTAKDRFTPSGGSSSAGSSNFRWSLLNWRNNPYSNVSGYRVNFKIRHKIGDQGLGSTTDEDKAKKASTIQGAYYTLQAGYERRRSNAEDFQHGENLFNYGYVGSTERQWVPTPGIVNDLDAWGGDVFFDAFGLPWAHLGYAEVEEEFVPSENINSVLAKYENRNGDFVSPALSAWNIYANVGQVYNNFSKGENTRITFNLTSGFDLLPGGSEKGRHSIKFGVSYEQQIDRGYGVSPIGLWELANINANRHIVGIDTTNSIGVFTGTVPTTGESFDFPQYQTLINEESSQQFFRRIRELTGQSLNEYVNVDALDPSQLSLGLFSPRELNDQALISYRGYDYLGNKVGTNVSFEDFFNARDEQGNRTFEVAPTQPIYGAAYIQDKFSYKDIIFRLGVRLDYFDANTKVMKDQYSLYDIESADEFYTRTNQEMPSAVGGDYKVYIAGEESTNVIGFRDGNQWFLPNGESISNSGQIFGGGVVTPALRNPGSDIQSAEGYDINNSFEDYTPDVNIMPRLAFSFPISEEAGFFAHYDVLVQRPTSNNIATARNYFYFPVNGRTPSGNPNLKSEKTIDYEVGFQQKVTSSSAIKMSAFYRELRDNIQQRVLLNTFPVNQYTTYDNIDFGTVKGFSFNYDRRRTNNLKFTANYTLQFADGTGSDVNSSSGINSLGEIRTLSPFTYDERHTFNATIDYRYGSGKNYNGPRIGDFELLANTGMNIQMTTASGRPYTQRRQVTSFGGSGFKGGINEARLPWRFNIDLQLDKNLRLGGEDGGRGFNVNIYARILNVLNIKNVIGVYSFSGDDEDDGYLLSSFGEDRISEAQGNGLNSQAFVDAYGWALANSGFYTLPRRIYLGATIQF